MEGNLFEEEKAPEEKIEETKEEVVPAAVEETHTEKP